MRILVAVEPIAGRKGIDSLVQLCREKLAADPFPAAYLFSEAAGRPRFVCWRTMARDFGWRRSGCRRAALSGGRVVPNQRARSKPIRHNCCRRPGTRIPPPLPSGEK